ncbi:hypothetical protein FA95DRAFT_545231 [Auriscalpium vulgare]|uniref:Uncharacterized protein n=1 Tax=Auriscalpium vulgare TaxID=40419 RepID=A0ACB8RFF8_9AGAM|nr:hypothetical protein FA95DRAFT_545231 [Auriscalpium vulgare]
MRAIGRAPPQKRDRLAAPQRRFCRGVQHSQRGGRVEREIGVRDARRDADRHRVQWVWTPGGIGPVAPGDFYGARENAHRIALRVRVGPPGVRCGSHGLKLEYYSGPERAPRLGARESKRARRPAAEAAAAQCIPVYPIGARTAGHAAVREVGAGPGGGYERAHTAVTLYAHARARASDPRTGGCVREARCERLREFQFCILSSARMVRGGINDNLGARNRRLAWGGTEGLASVGETLMLGRQDGGTWGCSEGTGLLSSAALPANGCVRATRCAIS